MRPDFQRFAEFEREMIRNTPADHRQNRRLMEAGRELAISLGVWPPEDPLKGIEADIRVARALNVRSTST